MFEFDESELNLYGMNQEEQLEKGKIQFLKNLLYFSAIVIGLRVARKYLVENR